MSQLWPLYLTFLLISLSGALSPGPLTVLAIGEGARTSRWAGVKLAAGHALVEIPLVMAIAYGLGVWLRQPLVSGLVGLIGGLVLLWMGYGMAADAWRRTSLLNDDNTRAGLGSLLRYGHVAGGAALTLVNPYWSLWWATVGAGRISQVLLVQPAWWAVLGLGAIHWLSDLGWLGGLSLAIGSGRKIMSDRVYRGIVLVCGVFLVLFGVYVAWGGVGFLRSIG
jgi:threonine/homoserine/homoserine lactone efflux protein